MTSIFTKSRAILVVVAVFGLIGAMAGISAAAPAPAADVPAPQVLDQTCGWNNFGQSNRAVFHAASAMDTVSNTMYVYGGLNQTGSVQNGVVGIDLSGTIAQASHGVVSASGALERYGAAGAFRTAEGEAYFFGGADAQGDGNNNVQVYDVASGTWGTVTVGGSQNRVFSAAAYSAKHDIIVIVGGAQTCKAVDFDPQNDECRAANSRTTVLSWDEQTNAPSMSASTISGGPSQILGHTLVSDAAGENMYLYGGTTANDSQGKQDVWHLDLTGDSPGDASWSQLTTQGTRPQGRFFHSAAYDSDNDRMIVFGGVRQNAFSNENAVSDTWALDFTTTPPTWNDLSTSESGSAVASVMEYDTNNMTPILHSGRRQAQGGQVNPTNRSYSLECEAPTPVTPTDTPMPTDTPDPSIPTETPGGTMPTVTPVTPPSGPGEAKLCDFVQGRAPQAAINFALTNNTQIGGWGQLCFPSRPPGFWNGFREYLSLRQISKPYHPLWNPLVYKCGCP